ncbi:hypothetical protein T492DRAFT_1059924 [Pavlovales sp. CCMP2436]|nr:hypothetical protein T492DRAFT_1059924 [Pavlovales sp. CCMP2436]
MANPDRRVSAHGARRGRRFLAAALTLIVCAPGATGSAVLGRARRLPSSRRAECRAALEFSVRLPKPLGIVFEEAEVGQASGVRVAGLVESGNAERDGRVCIGDELVATSAVIFIDKFGSGSFTSWERQMVPCVKMDFNAIMSAIGSNDGRFGCVDVVLKLRPTERSPNPRPMPEKREAPDGGVQWDGAKGVMNGRISMPIRPPNDNF